MAQGVLDGYDLWQSWVRRKEERLWRDEERRRRNEDMEYRQMEKSRRLEEEEFRNFKRRVRKQDIDQRVVDNSQYLWTRNKEINRRGVEEKLEHMRAMSWITSIIAGFTMTAPVEFGFDRSKPPWELVTAYAIATAIVPGIMIVAAMMSICLLGGLLKMGHSFVEEEEEEDFMRKCMNFHRFPYPWPPAPSQTFDLFWDMRCDDDWRRVFRFFCIGITTFFFVLGTMAYIKFLPNQYIPAIFTVILAISMFYGLWIQYHWGGYLTVTKARENQEIGEESLNHENENFVNRPRNYTPFDWHNFPRAYASFRSSSPETA